jgi:hypothetical protein
METREIEGIEVTVYNSEKEFIDDNIGIID